MPPRARWLPAALVAPILLVAHACAGRPAGPALRLTDVVRSYEQEVRPYHPFTASDAGFRQYDRVLANDIGEEYRRGLQALCARHRADLGRVDTGALTDEERLTHDILAVRLDDCVTRHRFPGHLIPVNQAGSSWPSRFPVVGAGRGTHPFRTPQNYEDFLGRVDGFVTWIDTAIANMRLGMARGITQPREIMVKVLPQLETQIVDDPRTSPFYEPIRNFPASFDEQTRSILEARYVVAIRQQIVPAYRRLREFVQDEYLPRCRTTHGLGALPDGPAWYAHAVRESTTTGLTPDEIYDLGIAEVARIRAGMDALRKEIAGGGDPPLARHHTVEDLLRAYAELRTAVDAAMPRMFRRFPSAGFEIRPIEAFRERSMPSSYAAASPDGSRPGVFYLNTAELRGSWGEPVARSLYLHEAVPGHHFQIALQRENRALPGFRRFGWYTAFGEGWALYAESLGAELGVYQNRRERLAMLGGELFRAARLVVDVGLHHRGWSREQAMAYLGGPTPGNEREVERYMAWPGQALGYKIGQLRILGMRRKAEAALGAGFDIRAFHDELLRDGAMPLDVLEAKMDRWIVSQRR